MIDIQYDIDYVKDYVVNQRIYKLTCPGSRRGVCL